MASSLSEKIAKYLALKHAVSLLSPEQKAKLQ